MTLRSNDAPKKRAVGRHRLRLVRLRFDQLEDRLAPAAAGALDTTFGPGGSVLTPIGSGADTGQAVAVDSSGRIVVAGTTFIGIEQEFAVVRYNSNGTPDTSFGTAGTGKVTTAFGTINDAATSVAIDKTGRIYVAGYTSSSNGTGIDFAIARYTPAGILDTSFGTAGTGKVVTAISAGSGTDEITAMTIDSTGRVDVAGFTSVGTNEIEFVVARYTSAGILDTSFGSGTGRTITAFGTNQDIARALTIDASGNIVVVGSTSNGSSTDFAVARYTTNGTPDPNFGNNGKMTTDFEGFNDTAVGVTTNSAGQIIVAGTASTSGKNEFAVARYTTAGILDPTFGAGGEVMTSFGSATNDVPSGVAMDNTGRIIVVGSTISTTNGTSQFAVARYTSAGVLDPTFGAGGETTLSVGGVTSGANAATLDGSGRIVAAGFASNGSNNDFAVARFLNDMPPVITSNGGGPTASVSVPEFTTAVTTVTATDPDPNTTFAYSISGGADGSQFTINPATGVLTFTAGPNFAAPTDSNHDNVYNVIVQVSDGYQTAVQAIAVTVTFVPQPPTFSSGTALDPTFGVNGVQATALPTSISILGQNGQNIAVDASGRFVVAGKSAGNNFAITRYLPTGAIDTNFGTNGSVTTAIGSDSLAGQCVTIDSSGNILVGGFLNGSSTAFAIARYTPAGALDTTFGVNGIQITSIGTNAQVEALTFDGAGNIIAVGKATVGSRIDIIVARYSSGGFLDTTFGSSGTVTAALGSSCNADSVIANSSGIVIAGEELIGSQQVMIVARFTTAGVLDSTFNATGVATATIGSGSSNANVVAIDSSNRIVIGGGGSSFALARFSSTGTPDSTFGASGIVNTSIGSGSAAIESLTFDSSGNIVVAGFSTVGSSTVLAAARYSSSGTLDSTFGSAGIVTATLAAAASAGKVTISSSGQILAAGVSGSNFELARYVPNVSDVTVAEDTTAVAAAAANNPDPTPLTYSIVGGADQAKFSINASTGVLQFVTPPDFENPTDSNGDNVYIVTEQVSVDGFTATQNVSVTVTNLTAANTTVYVNAAWANLASGAPIADADPTVSGNQPATFGVNAFAVLQGGAEAVTAGGTVVLLPGTYSLPATFSSAFSLSVPTGTASVTAAIGGSGGLTKIGTGTLTLTATNGYAGATTVSAGTLLVDGSIASSSSVSVGAAGTLGGTGSAGTSVSSSGIIAPGDAAPGTLSATFLTLGTGTLSLDLASSASYDRIKGSFVNITGTTLSLNLGTINDNDTYTILSIAGTSGGLTGTFVNLPTNNSTFAIGTRTFRINYQGGDGNDVVLTALPNSSLSVVSTILNGNGGGFVNITTGGVTTNTFVPGYIENTGASNQHSMVESVVYSFSQAINLSASNFSLTGFNGTTTAPTVNATSSNNGTVWTITFSGTGVNTATHSIGDGEYQLVLSGVAGGLTNTYDFFRLLGDIDGSGGVDSGDLLTLNGTFLRSPSDPGYLGAMDFDGSNTVDSADLLQFDSNFLHTVPKMSNGLLPN